MSSRKLIVLGALLLSGGLFSGCMYTGNEQLNEVRDDPSPTVDTLSQRSVDIDNTIVYTFDENGRMFWEDLGRLMLTDRPSRLAREPHLHP
ncbi:MAG TPA: hypothetical protein VHC70_05745 [Phycisphaerales bacterium]|jgi:hypothetical protein|nr:hypothetical protein [Phycisphaerales bacterium]